MLGADSSIAGDVGAGAVARGGAVVAGTSEALRASNMLAADFFLRALGLGGALPPEGSKLAPGGLVCAMPPILGAEGTGAEGGVIVGAVIVGSEMTAVRPLGRFSSSQMRTEPGAKRMRLT